MTSPGLKNTSTVFRGEGVRLNIDKKEFGKEYKIYCHVSGNPTPHIIWKKVCLLSLIQHQYYPYYFTIFPCFLHLLLFCNNFIIFTIFSYTIMFNSISILFYNIINK